MLSEIITIGDEILIGQIVDTNSAYISKELNKIGIKVYQITSVQDERQHILDALANAEKNVDLVVVTGGLGPTKDDITKATFCEFFNDALIENAWVLQNIKDIFSKHINRKPLPANLLQAMVPSKAIILNNEHGTAPGMWFEKDKTVFVSMPGVPYEMKYLLQNEVFPRLIKKFKRPFIYHKTLLTYGQGESTIADRIEDWENKLPEIIKLAYLPSLGRVRLRLSSTGIDEVALKKSVDEQMESLNEMLKDISVGFEDETNIVQKIADEFTKRNLTFSLAESCTGGAISAAITETPGVSSFFKGGIIPYETSLKSTILGIEKSIIDDHNVVSIQVAEEMALNSRRLFETDFALATTGIAGPTKGDGDNEVGTVCIAISTPTKTFSEKFLFGSDRERIIEKSVNKALEMILKEILKN